ncbi:MAG: penicillin acylase family protein, partial [Candidatus Hydrogenedentes bacterium]|nr:penicillin acylase family protein [Candidatus Hydrogenedentota bacterium]
VEAYVRGVNAALAAYTLPPPEFLLLQHAPAPWQPSDVYAMGALMAFQSAGNADSELLRMALVQALGADRAAIFLPDDGAQPDFPFVMSRADRRGADGVMAALEAFDAVDPLDQPLMPRFAFGSNGWAVAPGRSKTGHALFAFDSHDDLGVPNLFYEVHLFFEGTKQIRGWSVAGLPGVINGFNERIAWGFTNIGDSQDLFIETRAKDDPLEFRDGGSWYRARTETVEIPVKGRAAPETLTIVYTKNGPLISDDPPIALAWTAHDLQGAGIDAILAFNRAQNWDEFVAALDGLAAPTLNATYADIDGTIGFRTVGLIPVRGNGDGLVPLDGGDPANRWQGTVPQDAMPRLHNPAAGFVAAANARVNAAGEGPLVSSDNDPGYRIRRIRLVLSSRTDLTVDDMRALQTDWYDQQAELVMPAMMAALRADNLSGPARAAYDALDAWRGNWIAHPDGAAPIVFQAWYRALIGEVFAPGMPPDLFARLFKSNYIVNHAIDRLVLREVDSAWWRGERDAIVQRAFATAVLEVQAAQGGDVSSWRLDRMHRVRVDHELGKA